MKKKYRIWMIAFSLLPGCLYLPNKQVNPDQQSTIDKVYQRKINYTYQTKVCKGYDSSLDYRTNESAIYRFVFDKIKRDGLGLEFDSFRKSPLRVDIYIYRRFGCIENYPYKENEIYEDMWRYLSGVSLSIIPYWGNANAIVEYHLFKNDKFVKKFEYQTNTYEIGTILLLPFFWINYINGDFREDFLETFIRFHADLQDNDIKIEQ